MDSQIRTARNGLFLELKPICVELSQLALRGDGSQDNKRLLEQSLGRLFRLLEQKCQRTDGVFDQKLADYVFFPLSQILQKKKQYTDRLSEITLKCLNILLEYGWRTIELELAKQLLMLLTFVSGGIPGKEATQTPEEIISTAYSGLAALFRDIGLTPGGSSMMVKPATLPALGHCVTVMIDGATDGTSVDVQLQALKALRAAWQCIKDAEALASFLPGTISGLTKCLMPTTASKRTKKAIIAALQVLQTVLVSTLGDLRTRTIRNQEQPSSEVASTTSEQRVLSPSWLKATVAQIKLALSNVVRLRRHESSEVRVTLNQLCLTLLDECHETLAESTFILTETSMTLSGAVDPESWSETTTSLVDLASIYPDITEHVKNTVYSWVTSLPRVMQASDESAKVAALDRLSRAQAIFSGLSIDSSILKDSLANSLRDSVTLVLDHSGLTKYVEEAPLNLDSQAALSLVTENTATVEFRPFILAEQSQYSVLHHFNDLLAKVGTRDTRLILARDMLDYARSGATGSSLLSSFWLSSQILQLLIVSTKELDEFFDSSLTVFDLQDTLTEEIYSYALTRLTEIDDEQDWRIQAVALEVVAHTAQQRRKDFRSDLIDVLYPITQLLGSAQAQLREHAITSLNIISEACGYHDASDLIVSNADYMVNAISLRLNTFDISPSAPQVLVMMVRLAGPSLLLYLDDVVGSIFAALDNFHGYPLLVESLFSVLEEIVLVGSKSTELKIEGAKPISKLQKRPVPPAINDILSIITQSMQSPSRNTDKHEDFPRKPWKSAKTLLDEVAPLPPSDNDEDQQRHADDMPPEEHPPSDEIVIPPTKTHTLIHRITHQTQHHLTSSSPHLRAHLLNLIKTSTLSLPTSSIDFLPLINDIWPVVLTRLYDPEPYVSTAASEALCALCESAGDFLNTRFATEWSVFIRFARVKKLEADKEKKGTSGRGVYSMSAKVWEALTKLLVDVVAWVGVSDAMFDDVLGVVGVDVLKAKPRFVELLSGGRGNADAVWMALEMYEGEREWITPTMEGCRFADFTRGEMSTL